MFDYARLEDGRIVERIQQSDTLSQLMQMYSGTARKGAVAVAMLGTAVLALLGVGGGRSPEKRAAKFLFAILLRLLLRAIHRLRRRDPTRMSVRPRRHPGYRGLQVVSEVVLLPDHGRCHPHLR